MGRGEEEKSKKKKKRSRSVVSDADEEGKSKKHRSSDDIARKKEKKDKKKRKEKDKEKSKKSHRHSRNHEDKGTKSSKKRDQKHGKSSNLVDFEELSSGDYYLKNNEFSTWLKEEKGLFFSDLLSEDAHKLFISFVKDWNNKKLQSRYYEGITSAPRTGHSWKIRSNKDS